VVVSLKVTNPAYGLSQKLRRGIKDNRPFGRSREENLVSGTKGEQPHNGEGGHTVLVAGGANKKKEAEIH